MRYADDWLNVLFLIALSTWPPAEVDGLRCWQCDTKSEEGCGDFGLVPETAMNRITTECIPYSQIHKGCYNVQIEDTNDPTGDNTFMFCAPDKNETSVCNGASLLHLMQGRGKKVKSCRACREDLCNSSNMHCFSISYILTVFLIVVKFNHL